MSTLPGRKRSGFPPIDRLRPSQRATYVVCYDIVADRRRARVRRLLLNFGVAVQYSVFECAVTAPELRRLMGLLKRTTHPKLDSVLVYPLCRGCAGRIVRQPPTHNAMPITLMV